MFRCLLFSPAKVNLCLQVLSKREDGYHEIYTVFHKIDLFDEVEVERAKPYFELEFFSEEDVPFEENLVYKAWLAFKEEFNIPEEVKIKVKKEIPIGAGLGGGSSNAASVLKGLAYLYGIPWDDERLFKIAKKLGADVPFFLSPYITAIGEGIGEKLTPIPGFNAWFLLIVPNFKVSTAWAYQNLGLTKSKNPVYYSAELLPWEQEEALFNDFKDLIFNEFKELFDYEKWLKETGGRCVNLSGTGPTIFGIFPEEPPFFAYETLKKFLKNVRIFLAKTLEET
ncbi:MAG: 4-(cytidine 5'-diphospho)-2-C-methyl-D-erythritol kinase [Thermodesulfobacteria bacterium]|nr:4-(cytidine 5'-diphospho)-2-C-methyl-D-erythritol kinase [Thermodesulfobacteriota bacterium]